ncbi:13060_t:CDS:2 [Dentiscutata erythropus]|uniref:13060_t:CDS:1 n=1 Tax=Dentiscutata erythropus TaxID=1348616 RepID=A0A9N9H2W7_9GLOM|nr:13060_t:CDS:2 [Dentiscutata erythropus]
MNLIDGQLDIIPTAHDTSRRESLINCYVIGWCHANPHLAREFSSSQGCYTLPNGDILGPDVAVILNTRWNTLTDARQNEAYPPVAPNFIVELRSQSDSDQYIYNKMLRWMNGGVEEGWLIDLFVNPPKVRIYTLNANNQVVMQTLSNPTLISSTVLRGFVMMIGINKRLNETTVL